LATRFERKSPFDLGSRLAPSLLGHAAMKNLLGVSFVLTSLLGACAGSPDVEDPENDEFLTDDQKADAFGVEDWSPDGAAVLRLASSLSASKLEDDVGLSAKVAKAIVAQRATLTDHKFTDLADLDAAKYVGKTVFQQMLRYVAEHHLFKTSLRVPLLLEDENGDTKTPITTFNAKAHEVGLTGFARYTFVDSKTDYDAKMASYDTRLQALATKANITIGGQMLRYAYSYSDYTVGASKLCFIGAGTEVADVASSQAGVMTGEMYSIWGWRYRAKKVVDDNIENADEDFADTEWKAWTSSNKDVLMVYTNDDDGTHVASDIISPCR
jgi:hypothetical protein